MTSSRPPSHIQSGPALLTTRGSRTAQKKDASASSDRACNGQSLLLPAGKKHSLVADEGVVFFRLRQYELMRVGHLRGAINIVPGGVEAAKENVVVDGVVEQKRLLCDQADLFAQRLLS